MENKRKSKESVFLDKQQLTQTIVFQESEMGAYLSNLRAKMNQGFIRDDNIHESSDFWQSWKLLDSLFGFFQFNKLQNFEAINPEAVKELNTIMDKYKDPSKKKTIHDLEAAVTVMRELISYSGYHDDTTRPRDLDIEHEFL